MKAWVKRIKPSIGSRNLWGKTQKRYGKLVRIQGRNPSFVQDKARSPLLWPFAFRLAAAQERSSNKHQRADPANRHLSRRVHTCYHHPLVVLRGKHLARNEHETKLLQYSGRRAELTIWTSLWFEKRLNFSIVPRKLSIFYRFFFQTKVKPY